MKLLTTLTTVCLIGALALPARAATPENVLPQLEAMTQALATLQALLGGQVLGVSTSAILSSNPLAPALWPSAGGPTSAKIPLPAEGIYTPKQVRSSGQTYHRIGTAGTVQADTTYNFAVRYRVGTSPNVAIFFTNKATGRDARIAGAHGNVNPSTEHLGPMRITNNTRLSDGTYVLTGTITPNFTGTLELGVGPGSSVNGQDIIVVAGGVAETLAALDAVTVIVEEISVSVDDVPGLQDGSSTQPETIPVGVRGTVTPFTTSFSCANTSALRGIPTFESLGLYLDAGEGIAQVRYRQAGRGTWQAALPLSFDNRTSEGVVRLSNNARHRGSLVYLNPDTSYEVQVLHGGTLYCGTFKTRSDNFPIAEIINIGERTSPLVITRGGSENGYIVYEGGSLMLSERTTYGIEINADYVILRDTLVSGSRYGVRILDGRNDVVIEDSEITNWGLIDTVDAGREGPSSQFWGYADGGILIGNRTARITIQNNNIHTPRTDANTWGEFIETPYQCISRPRSRCHPHGPRGIMSRFDQTDVSGTQRVIRYNTISGTREHMFEDAISIDAVDADIYGNYISGFTDDGVEMDGIMRNVRIWDNQIHVIAPDGTGSQASTGAVFSFSPIYSGPTYVWRNLATTDGLVKVMAVKKQSGTDGTETAALSHPSSEYGRLYYFNNTTLGGRSISGSGFTIRNIYAYNNISIGGFQTDAADFQFDYNMYPATQNQPNGFRASPKLNTNFILENGATGVDGGVIIPNFISTFSGRAPDLGYRETGQSMPRFGMSVMPSRQSPPVALVTPETPPITYSPSQNPLAPALWPSAGGPTSAKIPLPAEGIYTPKQVRSSGQTYHRIGTAGTVQADTTYNFAVRYRVGTSPNVAIFFTNKATGRDARIAGAHGNVNPSTEHLGPMRITNNTRLSDGTYVLTGTITPNFTGTLELGVGPGSSVNGQDIIVVAGGVAETLAALDTVTAVPVVVSSSSVLQDNPSTQPETVPSPAPATPTPVTNDTPINTPVIVTDTVNVRSAPAGSIITVKGSGGGGTKKSQDKRTAAGREWVEVQFDDNQSGWVASEYVVVAPTTPALTTSIAPTQNRSIVRTTDNLNVRRTPGGSLITMKQQGSQAERSTTITPVTTNNLTWEYVTFTDGTAGWVAASYLAPVTTPTPVSTMSSADRARILIQITQLLQQVTELQKLLAARRAAGG